MTCSAAKHDTVESLKAHEHAFIKANKILIFFIVNSLFLFRDNGVKEKKTEIYFFDRVFKAGDTILSGKYEY